LRGQGPLTPYCRIGPGKYRGVEISVRGKTPRVLGPRIGPNQVGTGEGLGVTGRGLGFLAQTQMGGFGKGPNWGNSLIGSYSPRIGAKGPVYPKGARFFNPNGAKAWRRGTGGKLPSIPYFPGIGAAKVTVGGEIPRNRNPWLELGSKGNPFLFRGGDWAGPLNWKGLCFQKNGFPAANGDYRGVIPFLFPWNRGVKDLCGGLNFFGKNQKKFTPVPPRLNKGRRPRKQGGAVFKETPAGAKNAGHREPRGGTLGRDPQAGHKRARARGKIGLGFPRTRGPLF